MSIIFTAGRIAPDDSARAASDGSVSDGRDQRLDLGKDWAVMFRVLNFGEEFANPALAALAISGGRHLRPEGDYGGPRLLDPALVADIAAALAEFDEDEIEHRFACCDTTGAYGAPLDLPSVLDGFRRLSSFYQDAAEAGDAILIHLR